MRTGGVDRAHVQRLAETFADLPPLLVHVPSMTVIDGLHRLAIATERGDTHVRVQFVDGSDFDLLAIAIRSNVTHGLPLSLEDRRAALHRLLALRPDWSDRRLGRLAGVSPGLVAKIRGRLSDEVPASGTRVGLDGKARPLSAGEGRLRVAALLAERAEAPVREVAAAAGVSVATAQDVRNRISRGIDPLPERLRPRRQSAPEQAAPAASAGAPCPPRPEAVDGVPGGAPTAALREARPGCPDAAVRPVDDVEGDLVEGDLVQAFDGCLDALRGDPSVRSTEAGRQLLRLMSTQRTSLRLLGRLAAFVPPHRVGTVVGLARSLADAWSRLAHDLDHRQRHGGSAGRARGGTSKVS